jgi:hypothetical protein
MIDTKDKDLDSVAKLVLGQYALSDAIYFSLPDSQSLFTDPFQFLSGDINELGLKKGRFLSPRSHIRIWVAATPSEHLLTNAALR